MIKNIMNIWMHIVVGLSPKSEQCVHVYLIYQQNDTWTLSVLATETSDLGTGLWITYSGPLDSRATIFHTSKDGVS